MAVSLVLRGGRIVTEDGVLEADVKIEDGRIVAIGAQSSADTALSDAATLDAAGKLIFPGLIDPQVHFREPGNTHKEDLASGSLAAVAGGVTTFFEMPNTRPSTTTPALLEDKLARAAERSFGDYAFFLGASAENASRLGEWECAPGCAGVKVFMGSSTGSLLVADDATLERVLRSGTRRVAVHSEDEPRLVERYAALGAGASVSEHPEVRDVETAVRATQRLLDLVERTRRPVHLLHVSTAEEIALLRERDLGDLVTAEVTPNHLFLAAPGCYETHGTGAQMNPPVRELRHQEALRQALVDGVLACIGSDHAPHTPSEKARPYPTSPSGIPGVQTILPLLLTAVDDGWLRLEDVARVTAGAPARVYGVLDKGAIAVGNDADLTIVDPGVVRDLPLSWLRSRAGWSPFVGTRLAGWPECTLVRGTVVYERHGACVAPAGRPVRFASTVDGAAGGG